MFTKRITDAHVKMYNCEVNNATGRSSLWLDDS